ncbi:MAG: hypothetical protein ABW137_12210 [Mycobacterium sp.]
MTAVRVAFISAVQAAISPATAAFAAEFAGAEVWNVLDDRLLSDASARGGLDEALTARMCRLIAHAIDGGADAVLLTCSLYASVAHEKTTARLPVLAPDESAFAQLVADGYNRVLVVASFDSAAQDSAARLRAVLADASVATIVESVVVADARPAADAGDKTALERALINHLAPLALNFDAVFLAQYSLAPAGRTLSAALGLPVLSGPVSAARHLAHLLAHPVTDEAPTPAPDHRPHQPATSGPVADTLGSLESPN